MAHRRDLQDLSISPFELALVQEVTMRALYDSIEENRASALAMIWKYNSDYLRGILEKEQKVFWVCQKGHNVPIEFYVCDAPTQYAGAEPKAHPVHIGPRART